MFHGYSTLEYAAMVIGAGLTGILFGLYAYWRRNRLRVLGVWSDRLPCRLIYGDNDEPYLRRYYVTTIFGLRVYLHQFVGSDPNTQGLHSHPWRWALSIILFGWYFEERFRGDPGEPPIRRAVRRWNLLMGESFHRVVMPTDGYTHWPIVDLDRTGAPRSEPAPTECWSLFIHRDGAERRWGFMQVDESHLDTTNGETKPGRFIFRPFTYPGGGKRSGEWWKTAPTGAETKQIEEDRRAKKQHEAENRRHGLPSVPPTGGGYTGMLDSEVFNIPPRETP